MNLRESRRPRGHGMPGGNRASVNVRDDSRERINLQMRGMRLHVQTVVSIVKGDKYLSGINASMHIDEVKVNCCKVAQLRST